MLLNDSLLFREQYHSKARLPLLPIDRENFEGLSKISSKQFNLTFQSIQAL